MAYDDIGVEEAVKDARHNFFGDAHPGILDADANLIPYIDHINVYIPPSGLNLMALSRMAARARFKLLGSPGISGT